MHPSERQKLAGWTRREFVRGAAGMLALPHLSQHSAIAWPARHIAYVASGPGSDAAGAAGRGFISVLTARPGAWALTQRVPSLAPTFLLHTPQQMLYVANGVGVHGGMARGAVEAFRTDPADGTLTLAGTTPLSLSATHPKHLALSPDGAWLAVAAYGGGIYNLLPVANDGSLGAPRAIFKDVGCGPHPALQTSSHPHTLFFDDSGKHLLATDFGLDRISIFRVEDGRFTRIAQQSTGSGTGPGVSVPHPAGWLYTSHRLGNTIGCYRSDHAAGAISEPRHEVASACGLALHPSGRALYAVDGRGNSISVWQVDARSGRLTRFQNVSLPATTPAQVFASSDGQSVFLLDRMHGSMMQIHADPVTGKLSNVASQAAIHAPRAIALKAI